MKKPQNTYREIDEQMHVRYWHVERQEWVEEQVGDVSDEVISTWNQDERFEYKEIDKIHGIDSKPITEEEIWSNFDMTRVLGFICPACGGEFPGHQQCRNTGKCKECSENYEPVTPADLI